MINRNIDGYTELSPFKYWCHKVLPLVYDDSLSYYELLCKVIEYLNNTMSDVTLLADNFETLRNEFNQLKNYVDTFIEETDFNEIVKNILDVMVADGTLGDIIAQVVNSNPIFVTSTSEMTDTSRTYVLAVTSGGVTSGHIYSYNGTQFVDTGVTYSAGDNTMWGADQINRYNYIEKGISDVSSFHANRIYSIDANITNEMITNLPVYGSNGTIVTFKPNKTGVGFTVFLYVNGSASTVRCYIAFGYSGNNVSKWLELTDYGSLRSLTTLIGVSNHASLGLNNILDFKPNCIYGISSNITANDISGLPTYGEYGQLQVLSAYTSGLAYTTMTTYLYTTGNNIYMAISLGNNQISRWRVLSGGSDRTLTVGSGCEYATITEAVNKAIDGDTILIYNGVYEEDITAIDKSLHFVGVDRDSVIVVSNTGDYNRPPFEIASGSIRNMTIIVNDRATTEHKPYCIHCDYNYSANRSLVLENLILKNECHACLGIGIRPNFEVEINNVQMVTENETQTVPLFNSGVFYTHSATNTVEGRGRIRFKDCVLEHLSGDYAMILQPQNNNTCSIDFDFINTTAIANGSTANSIISNGYGQPASFATDVIKKSAICHNNNVASLNS